MTSYNAKTEWSKVFQNSEMTWPAENVIRIFKGSYPRLNLDKKGYPTSKICDIGFGDGCNLRLLKQCGFDIYGVEITQDIVDAAKRNLNKLGMDKVDLRVGNNASIPFDNQYFDYLLSWNSCYYMGDAEDFNQYIKEFSRVLKRNGILVLSIPKKSCFIYHDSEMIGNGYCIIRNDPFKIRNGERFRIFENEREIETAFGQYFGNFRFASVHDDFFGYDYHWHLAVCQRK